MEVVERVVAMVAAETAVVEKAKVVTAVVRRGEAVEAQKSCMARKNHMARKN